MRGGGRSLDTIPTAKFKVLDLFEIKNGKQPPLKKRYHIKEDNMINCITGVTENNGIGFYTTRDKHEIYTNEITLSKDGEYAGTAYLQTKEFMLAGHSTGLISKYPLRKNHLLYISGVLNRYQKMGYWKQGGVMGSVTIKRLKDIDLVLPTNPEVSELVPDWETMEDYVNGIKHLYKHKEESNHKEKLELLFELTGWTEQDLGNIENLGGAIIKALIDWNAMERYVAIIELQLLNRITNTLNT